MVKNKLYLNRIFYHLLVVVFFECNYCDQLLACYSPKKYIKRDIMRGGELFGNKEEKGIGSQLSFKSNCYNVTKRQEVLYVHDLYCREKGFFYKFFLQEHTTSRTYYLCWTIFEHVLKNLTGVVWVYKKKQDFEFYYGSVIGIGWYPQSLNFNKYFRIGFFDMFINLTSVFMEVCHFLCRKYFHMVHVYFRHISGPSRIGKLPSGERTDNILLGLYKKAIKETKYILVFDIDATSFQLDPLCQLSQLLIKLLCWVSFINIKTKFGIKIKMLQGVQILKFIKRVKCEYVSNISILVNSIEKNGYDSKGKIIHKITYHSPDVFIYSYMYDSHFFFGERDNIFWLLLELFIPSIEICLNHDDF